MRKVIWRCFLAMVLFVTMMITVSGCKKDIEQEDVTDITYEATELVIDGIQGEVSSYLVKNDKLYIYTYEVVSDGSENVQEAGIEKLRFYCANLDGSNLQEIGLEIEEGKYLSSIGVEESGTFIGMTVADNQKESLTDVELIRFAKDGKELLRTNIVESLEIEEDTLISRILLDDKANILLFGNSNVYILNQEFKLINDVKIEDGWQVMDVALAKNGQIVCVEREQNVGEISTQVRILDIEKGKWGDKLKLDCNAYLGSDYIMNGIDTDIYYKGASGIYSYDIASNESIKLLDYEASYLTLEEADRMIPMGDGEFLGSISGDANENQCGLVVYSKVDAVSLANKQTIIYGGLYVQEDVKNAIITFNKKNKDYKIEIKEYIQEEDPIGRLNADIIAGNAPDILQLNNLPAEKYVELGLLEDLTSYFEKDAEIKADDMIDSVLEAMKINEGLYYVSPNFSINTIVARTKDVGNKNGWTFGEMKTLLEEKGEDVRLFYNEDNKSKREILNYFLEMGHMDYVDWETGKCTFNSQEFSDILQYCNSRGLDKEKELSDAEITELVQSAPSRIRAGEVLLYIDNGLMLEQVQKDRQMFGEATTYIGYPNEEKQGSYLVLSNQIGISSESEVKEKAWEFVRTFMTRDYQGKNLNKDLLPTRQDCFDMKIQAQMTTETYTDEFGNVVEPLNHSWNWGGVEMQYAPVSQEDVDVFVDLINNTTKVQSYDDEIMNIVYEEAQVYFAGDRKLDETVQIIQERVETYVNEQR